MDRYTQFEAELLSELQEHIQHPIQKTPLELWAPKRIAAPERHVQLGLLTGHTVQQIHNTCEEINTAFHDIASMLGIHYHFHAHTLHPVAEQVWLWGYSILQKYMRLITFPGAIKSPFYCANHDRICELLKRACSENPDIRPTFIALYKSWTGVLPPLTSSPSSQPPFSPSVLHPVADDDPAKKGPLPEKMVESDPVQMQNLPSGSSVAASSQSASRLVLAVRSSHVERNKTRRNHRN